MKLTRRELLRLGLVGAGGIAISGLAGACGPKTDILTAPTFGRLLRARKDAGDAGLDAFLGGGDYVAPGDNYLVLFLQHGGANGARVVGAQSRLWIAPTVDPNAQITPVGPTPAPWYPYAHPDGGPPLPQGLNAAVVTFPKPGIWSLIAETTTGPRLVGTTVIQVQDKAHAQTKIPGDAAIPSVTPTVADNQGVDPICTRKPPCDMHRITLQEAITNGKPTAFIVGTPQFCMSRNCGPSLNELIAVESNLRGQVNFVHAEVYLNDQTQTIEQQIPSPTFKEWGFQSEPWLFLIDRHGVIASRFEGGWTTPQVTEALKPLVA